MATIILVLKLNNIADGDLEEYTLDKEEKLTVRWCLPPIPNPAYLSGGGPEDISPTAVFPCTGNTCQAVHFVASFEYTQVGKDEGFFIINYQLIGNNDFNRTKFSKASHHKIIIGTAPGTQ